jgi:hypothetical protein
MTEDIRPIPDPTALTSSAMDAIKEDLRREMASLRELIDQKFETVELRFNERDLRFDHTAKVAEERARSFEDRISDVRDRLRVVETKGNSAIVLVGWLITGAAVLISLVGLVYTHAIIGK